MSHTSREQMARARQKRAARTALPRRALLDVADEARERYIRAGSRVATELEALSEDVASLPGGERLALRLAAVESALADEGSAVEETLRALYSITDCIERWG